MSAEPLASLAVAAPFASAAVCAAIGPFVPRRVLDALAIATALFCLAACALLTAHTIASGTVVHWFGGWYPRHGIALGIAFVVDPAGALLAAFTAFLAAAALVYAWTYFDESGPPFPILMLVFVGALIGFFLTGDLFNLFVFFELMGAAAYALTSYRSEDESAVMGALTFAVVNSVGAFLILLGIALVYGRTGALNLAQMGHALGGRADGLVIVAFALIAVGLFVKAAVVPFHFWLADAHAVAPTPLCVMFSGIMVQAGIYAVARIYWDVFSGPLGPHEPALRAVLIAFGLLTAFVGGAMSFAQRHFKRLLAFSTISHAGILVCALGLFSPRALGGLVLYIVGHGLTKGGLFFCSGILLAQYGTVDVEELRGKLRGRGLGVLAIAVGALALAGMPPAGTFAGSSMLEEASRDAHLEWLPYAFIVAAALTGGSVLNALGRMAFGWGPPPDPHAHTPKRESKETDRQGGFPFVMFGTAAVLIVLAFAAGLAPSARAFALAAGRRFADRPEQLAVALRLTPSGPLALAPAPPLTDAYVHGALAAVLALAFAALALFGHRIPRALQGVNAVLGAPLEALRALHSGLVGDDVAWLVAGMACFGGALVLLVR